MQYELTVKIGSQKEQVFVSASLKDVANQAIEQLTEKYGHEAFFIAAVKKWKKNQFFFRTNVISSDLIKKD